MTNPTDDFSAASSADSGMGFTPWSPKHEVLEASAHAQQKWCEGVVVGDATSNELVCLAFGYSPEGCHKRALQIAALPELIAALSRADQFITNGIELGYIRMPDADTPDSAHHTPGIVRAALERARGGK
jgi:hypothetical protein